jgi:hypothetical protein
MWALVRGALMRVRQDFEQDGRWAEFRELLRIKR